MLLERSANQVSPDEPRTVRGFVVVASLALVCVAIVSLFVGVASVRPAAMLSGDPETWDLLWVSRIPRLLAVVLSGSAVGVAGLIMQGLTRNRFVAPSTAGTVESATLGVVVAVAWFGSSSVLVKMLIAIVFALAGTATFLAMTRRLGFTDVIVVPLVGIMFGGVIQAVATYVAFKFDLLQVLNTLLSGNFAAVVRGRYELLFLVGALTLAAYVFADRFTVASMGRDMAVNLGMSYERIMLAGLGLAATVTAVVVVVIGALPLLGLVVPNVATALVGDNVRRVLPATAIGGALFVLVCDIIGRTIRAPYEIPVGTVAGLVGGAGFIAIAVRGRANAH